MSFDAFYARLQTLMGNEKPYAWATRLGLKTTLSNIDRYKHIPREHTVRAIAAAAGCNYDWLMHGKGEPFPSEAETEPQAIAQEPSSAEHVEPAQSGKVAGTITPRSVDLETMKFVDQVLEEWLQERGLRLKPERRAGVLAVLCDYLAKGATAKDLQEMLKVLSA